MKTFTLSEQELSLVIITLAQRKQQLLDLGVMESHPHIISINNILDKMKEQDGQQTD